MNCRLKRNLGNHQETTNQDQRGSQTQKRPLGNPWRTDLGPLCMLQLLAWSFSGIPNCWSMGCLWSFCQLRTLNFTELPLPVSVWGEVPRLTATWYAMFGCYPWEDGPFQKRNREKWMGGGEYEWLEGKNWGETAVWMDGERKREKLRRKGREGEKQEEKINVYI